MSARENPVSDLPPLVRAPVGQTIISLAVPGMVGVLAMMATSVLDMYLARYLGTTEQAALQQVFPVTMMLTSVALGLMVGTLSLVARTRGTGDLAGVRRIAGQAILLAALIIGLLTLLGLASYQRLFAATKVSAEVMHQISAYLDIWFLGTAVMVFPTLGNGVLRACGNAVASSVVLIITGILKCAVAPVMVLGLFGCPQMGVAGAALSNIISYGGASLMTVWYLRRDNLVTLQGLKNQILETWRNILRIGLPSAFTNLLMPVCGFAANVLVTPFGAATVAGFGSALRIESLALVPLFALSGSIGPFLGQNMGAGRHDRLASGFSWVIKFSLLYGLLIAALMFLSGNFLSSVFVAEAQAIAPSRLYLWLVPATYGFYGMLMMAAGAFNGLGNPKPNLVLYCCKAIFFALGILIGAELDGYRGICLGIAFSNLAAGIPAYFWYRAAKQQWARNG